MSIRKHLPRRKTVHGIEIKKLPIGRFLDSVESLSELPKTVIDGIFPDFTFEQAYEDFLTADGRRLTEIFIKALTIIPDEILKFLSTLLEIDLKYLRDNLSLNDVLDLCLAVWEINEIGNFTTRIRELIPKKTR